MWNLQFVVTTLSVIICPIKQGDFSHLPLNTLLCYNYVNWYSQTQIQPVVVQPWRLTKRRYSQQVSEWDKFCRCHLVQTEWCADVLAAVRYIAEWSTLELMSRMPADQQTSLENLHPTKLSNVTIQHESHCRQLISLANSNNNSHSAKCIVNW